MQDSTEPWGLDTRHLVALAAIARTRSVSKAAEELGYGQSAVSQQLAALERIVGHRLVDRGTGPRPVTLTAAGEMLLTHTNGVLDRLAAARRDLDRLDTGQDGSVAVGTFQSAGARLLPGVLAAFRASWPGIRVSIRNETQDGELPELIRSGALDAAFLSGASLGPEFEQVHLMTDRFVALVPPGHRLANRTSVSLSDFAGEDMVEGALGEVCSTRGEAALRAAGVETTAVFRTEDNPTRQRLVDAGLGCAVLPGLTVEPGLPNGAVIIPIVEDLSRAITLTWAADRTRSAALQRFIETTKQVVATISAASDASDVSQEPAALREPAESAGSRKAKR